MAAAALGRMGERGRFLCDDDGDFLELGRFLPDDDDEDGRLEGDFGTLSGRGLAVGEIRP
jgi:hypothetical protein